MEFNKVYEFEVLELIMMGLIKKNAKKYEVKKLDVFQLKRMRTALA